MHISGYELNLTSHRRMEWLKDVQYDVQHIRKLWQGEAGSSNELEQLEKFVSILVCLEFNFSIW